jgi:cytochrome oxidase assembly protein ShyY1
MSRARTLLFGWVLAVVAIASFTSLGFWQSRRAVEKQAMLDAAADVLAARKPVPLDAAADHARRHDYDWSSGEGAFDARGPLWLDNQSREGRSGVRAYRLFVPDRGAPLLVDMGWRRCPATACCPIKYPSGRVEVRGLPRRRLYQAGAGRAWCARATWLLTRIDTERSHRAGPVGAGGATLLRLDPALPMGHTRDLRLL